MPTSDSRHGSVGVFDRLWEKDRHRPVEELSEAHLQSQLFDVVKQDYLDALFPPPPCDSLECGCGTAGVSLHFARRGYRATMLDASENALALARAAFARGGQAGEFVKGSVEAMPFADDSFDVVMSFGLIEHFEDIDAVFREMVRVLRPGGLLFVDIVSRRFSVQWVANLVFNNWLSLIFHTVKRGPREGVRRFLQVSASRYEFYENSYPRSRYIDALQRAGLVDVVVSGNNPVPHLYLPRPAERIYVRLLKRLIPLWRRFDGSRGYFVDDLWPRGWWGRGHKRPSPV